MPAKQVFCVPLLGDRTGKIIVIPKPQYLKLLMNNFLVQAYNVKGCTGVDEAWSGSFAGAGPVEGTGAYSGTVISFGPKGFGFISMGEGQPELFFNAKDCVGSKPVTGDTVKFDLTPSDAKPGQMQARSIQVQSF